MQSKPFLELADIKLIAAAAEAEAVANKWAVSISIVDDGGHLLWLQRLDGAAPISAQIAPAKARTLTERVYMRTVEALVSIAIPGLICWAPADMGLMGRILAAYGQYATTADAPIPIRLVAPAQGLPGCLEATALTDAIQHPTWGGDLHQEGPIVRKDVLHRE